MLNFSRKKGDSAKPQLCLHFSQLLSQIFKVIFCFCLAQLRPKGFEWVIAFGNFSVSKPPLECKEKKQNKQTTKQKTPLTHNTPSCSTSYKFCNTSVLLECPAVACFPFDEF